jgi:NADP-dependent 3-hydroxy acid dehydrogenase YdfG
MHDETPDTPHQVHPTAAGPGLEGQRILVVGASAGIGRAFALRALTDGASVVASSRRAERLLDLVDDFERGTAAVGDVRQEENCTSIVEQAVTALGEIDLIVYSAGVANLRPLASTSRADWSAVLETHVLGLHHVVQASLGHLSASGVIAVLSSETVGRPRYGLGAYGASKAALEESVRAWRTEHPTIRFATIAIGACFPTEFGNDFDGEELGKAFEHWALNGLMTQDMMDPDDVAGTLAGILGTALTYPQVGLEHVVLRPNSPVVGLPPA